MVIWITGLSGAGKTTICETIVRMAKPSIAELVVLDGDVIRKVFGDELGYTEADRIQQIKRIQNFSKELEAQGLFVLVAALYANSELLKWNRENFKDYAEIYLEAPLSLLEDRDPKGLYAKVQTGEMKDVVGIDIPWNAPTNATLKINMTDGEAPEVISQRIIDTVPELSAKLAPVTPPNV
jgi:adenylyl-sulfate kinase